MLEQSCRRRSRLSGCTLSARWQLRTFVRVSRSGLVAVVIEGYVGRPGSGKSYTMTARALEACNEGRQVYCNFTLRHPNAERIAIEDLLDAGMPPGLVLIDEAHLWFPARLSMKLPPSLLMKLSQTRKMGWDLIWIAQHETRVDKVLRDVTNWLWLCNHWLPGMGGGWFTATCWEPEKFRKPKKHAQRSVRRFDQSIADAYDTFESLVVADHVAQVKDHYGSGVRDAQGNLVRLRRGPRGGDVAESAG